MKMMFKKVPTFIRFLLSGGLCFIIDILLFTLFNTIFKNTITENIIYATILARIISSFTNYNLNRSIVFKKDQNKKIDRFTLTKYFLLVIIVMFISAYSVKYLFELTNINESLLKIIVDIILCIINYFIQKYLIFNAIKKHHPITILILAIVSSIGILYQPIITDSIIKIDYQNHVLLSFILAIGLYSYYKKYNNVERRKSFSVLSFIFTIILIIGYSIQKTGSFTFLFDHYQYVIITLIKYIAYYSFINLSLNVLYEYLEHKKIEKPKENKIIKLFKKNPFLFSVVTLGIVYLIYLIAYYPGIVGYDPSYQIKEIMGIPNFYSESAGITGNMLLTNYNPILHTLLIGYLFKIGLLFGNVNFGIFLYTILQMSFMIYVLSYSIKFLYQEKVPIILLFIILVIYTFVPIFPFYSLCSFKDTYFALFFMLYIIELCKLFKYQFKEKDIVRFIIITSCLFFFRHNGILTFIMTLPFFLIIKENSKAIIKTIIGVLIIFFAYNGIIYACKITPTSRREVMAVPFQQIARLVSKKEEIIDDIDKVTINKIIDYKAIKEKYNPELVDPIKNTFKNTATNDDLKDFIKVWKKYFIKEPRLYFEATLNNMYGYIYPNAQNWYFYHMKYNVLNDVGFDYHYNNLDGLRGALYGYGEVFAYIPILNLFVNIGIITWIYLYLIGYLIESKNKKYILLLLPMFSILITCILGPVNTYYRYVIPYSFSLPTLLAIIYMNTKKVNH